MPAGKFENFIKIGTESSRAPPTARWQNTTADVAAEILCPTSGVVFFAMKKPLATEHEVAFKIIRRLHGGQE